MMFKDKITTLLLGFSLLFLGSCSDQWEEHTTLNDGIPSDALLAEIKGKPELSTFAGLLESSGLDITLAATRLFTVWAPTNEAFSNNSIAVPEDSAGLMEFLLNHISYERVNYDGKGFLLRHKMANGKHLMLDAEAGTIDGVDLIGDDDLVAKNGVLHMVGEVLNVKKNLWDYLKNAEQGQAHVNYIFSQDRAVFNPEIATQIGIDPGTGAPIYDTITGMETINAYLRDVVDLRDESLQLTYFVLSDPVLQSETNRFRKYFIKPTERETDSLTTWNVLKDAVVSGETDLDDLDGTFTSIDNVTFSMQKGAVIDSYKGSNGTVYFVNSLNVDIAERVRPVIIEAEFPYPDTLNVYQQKTFKVVPNRLQDFTRSRPYASGGYDILLSGHRLNPGYIDFIIDGLNTVKYEMYWVSVQEQYSDGAPVDTVSYTQSLRKMKWVFTDTLFTTMELVVDSDYISNEILPSHITNPMEKDLGILNIDTLNHYDSYYDRDQGYFKSDNCMRLRVQGSGNNTPISLDYIKMVPILE